MLKTFLAAALLLTIAGCAPVSSSMTNSAGGSAGASAKPQAFTFGRTYKVGEIDSYAVKMEQSTGNVVMSMTLTQEITKVYDNGDADMKETTSDMVMNIGGKQIQSPQTPPVTLRVDKNGAPQGGSQSGMDGGFGAALSRITSGISVGQTVPYDYTNPGKAGTHDVGKITYVSADGSSKFHVVSDITDADKDTTHMEGDMSLDTASKKPISVDLTMTTTGKRANTTHLVMTLKTP